MQRCVVRARVAVGAVALFKHLWVPPPLLLKQTGSDRWIGGEGGGRKNFATVLNFYLPPFRLQKVGVCRLN